MKGLIFKVILIAAFFISSVSFAQGINKKSLLNELNKTYGVALSTDEKTSFENANSTLVLELFGLDEKNLSKENRDKEIDKLFDKRDKTLTSSLGINKYSDIKSQTDEKIAETIQKVKQAKMAP
jgi:serine protease inhibitor